MKRPKIADDVEFDNKRVYDPFTGTEIQINQVTEKILSLCDGSRTEKEIAEELSVLYDTEPSDILPDVEETVEQLEQFRMLATKDRAIRKIAVRVDRLYKKAFMKIVGGQ
jgi:hypothetical protein